VEGFFCVVYVSFVCPHFYTVGELGQDEAFIQSLDAPGIKSTQLVSGCECTNRASRFGRLVDPGLDVVRPFPILGDLVSEPSDFLFLRDKGFIQHWVYPVGHLSSDMDTFSFVR